MATCAVMRSRCECVHALQQRLVQVAFGVEHVEVADGSGAEAGDGDLARPPQRHHARAFGLISLLRVVECRIGLAQIEVRTGHRLPIAGLRLFPARDPSAWICDCTRPPSKIGCVTLAAMLHKNAGPLNRSDNERASLPTTPLKRRLGQAPARAEARSACVAARVASACRMSGLRCSNCSTSACGSSAGASWFSSSVARAMGCAVSGVWPTSTDNARLQDHALALELRERGLVGGDLGLGAPQVELGARAGGHLPLTQPQRVGAARQHGDADVDSPVHRHQCKVGLGHLRGPPPPAVACAQSVASRRARAACVCDDSAPHRSAS